ncbi:MAG: toll/interleukin-1 receptor domain-containing protein, partial [Phormidesmis sp.]
MAEQQKFDVFLCHNSEDKAAVIEIAQRLLSQDIRPWLDEWNLRPGQDLQDALDTEIEQFKTAAVFVGSKGLGPWQRQEIKVFLREFVERGCWVIPVLLGDAPQEPELPTFLKGKTWVDFRRQVPDPFDRLVWGITGIRPGAGFGAAGSVTGDGKLLEPIVTSRAIATADSFEEQYLACQASDVQALRSDGSVQHG